MAPSSPVKPTTPTKSSAIDDAVASQGPASPLFSDDNGAVSPLRLDIPTSLDSEARPSAVEARQREVIAAMRRDLELLRENAASDKQERQREVKRLRDRANESDERRAEAARVVAKRVESLERDVEARDAELRALRARAPSDDGERVKQLTKAIRELTRKNDELRRQRDEARAELARLQTEEPPLSASKELRSLKAQLAARDAKRAANPPPPPDRYLSPPPGARRCAGRGRGRRGRPRRRRPANNDLRRASEDAAPFPGAGSFCHTTISVAMTQNYFMGEWRVDRRDNFRQFPTARWEIAKGQSIQGGIRKIVTGPVLTSPLVPSVLVGY